MRLYLSSFRLGDHPDRLISLLRDGSQVLVIANGLDGASSTVRRTVLERTSKELSALALEVRELDLRAFFGTPGALGREVDDADLLWACGGNVFTLNMAMRQSGFAEILLDRLGDDRVAYGGYSAGAVVAGSTLRGFEFVDSPDPGHAVPPGYRPDLSWEGLGLVPYAIIPHYRSNHHESEDIGAVVRHCRAAGIEHRTLRDGGVLVLDGARHELLPAREGPGEPS